MSWTFNPFTGNFDKVGSASGSASSPDNFSYKTIALSTTVTIPVDQQMIVVNSITIDGTLVNDGDLFILGV